MPILPLSWTEISDRAAKQVDNLPARDLRKLVLQLIEAHEGEVELQVDAADGARVEARGEYLDLLDKYGGHVECYLGLVTGRKLDAMCTCGWNDVQTEIERRTDK